MFEIHVAFSRVRRRKIRTLMNLLISMSVVLFVNIYAQSRENSREQIASLPQKIPVEAVITSLNGSKESGLYIKDKLYKGLRDSEHIKDLNCTLELSGEIQGKDYIVLAADSWSGYEELFEEGREKCIVSEAFAQELGVRKGDHITIKLESYEPEPENRVNFLREPLQEVTYEIWEIAGENDERKRIQGNILISLETARKSYDYANREFHVSACSFCVKNPYELNAFKEEMSEIGLAEVTPQASVKVDGNALVVKDQTFIRAAGSLKEGDQLIQLFLPILYLMLGVAGYITSYLMVAGEKKEYALMRLLGLNRRQCARVYLMELGSIQVLGGILGSVISVIGMDSGMQRILMSFLIFMCCFLLGTITVVYRFGKISIMDVLVSVE